MAKRIEAADLRARVTAEGVERSARAFQRLGEQVAAERWETFKRVLSDPEAAAVALEALRRGLEGETKLGDES